MFNLINVEDGELSFYLKDGTDFSISLSQTQLAIVCKILGFSFNKDNSFNCLSDESLKKIVEMKGNPLRLKEVD